MTGIASMSEETAKAIRKTINYMNSRRKLGKCGKITQEGIEITLSPQVADAMSKWNEEVLVHREKCNEEHDDTGPQRLDEGITGKLAEIACRIAGPLIPLERDTGEFTVDFNIIKRGHVGYDCDLNKSVTVKTSGGFGGYSSWLAAPNDVVRCRPDGIRVILCETMENENKFLIRGWVWAKDLYGKWNEPLSPKMNRKKAIYLDPGDKLYKNRKIKVFGGGVREVMHPITEV